MLPARSNNSLAIGLGSVGLLLGGFVGFLLRPTVPLVNAQLPFETVITRGAYLTGTDQMFVSLAQTSFNYMLAVAVVGTVVGFTIGYFISVMKREGKAQGGSHSLAP